MCPQNLKEKNHIKRLHRRDGSWVTSYQLGEGTQSKLEHGPTEAPSRSQGLRVSHLWSDRNANGRDI